MTAFLTDIEHELQARLTAVFADRVRAIGPMPDLSAEKLLQRFAADAPAIYFAPDEGSNDDPRMTVSVVLLLLTRNAQSATAARQGDGVEIGLYDLLHAVMALAGGWLPYWRWTRYRFSREAAFTSAGLEAATITLTRTADSPRVAADIVGLPPHEITDLLGISAFTTLQQEPLPTDEVQINLEQP